MNSYAYSYSKLSTDLTTWQVMLSPFCREINQKECLEINAKTEGGMNHDLSVYRLHNITGWSEEVASKRDCQRGC